MHPNNHAIHRISDHLCTCDCRYAARVHGWRRTSTAGGSCAEPVAYSHTLGFADSGFFSDADTNSNGDPRFSDQNHSQPDSDANGYPVTYSNGYAEADHHADANSDADAYVIGSVGVPSHAPKPWRIDK
jgi:hypothetical protein